MIEKMKKVSLVTTADRKREMLRALRKTGVLHVSEHTRELTAEGENLKKRGEAITRISGELAALVDKKNPVSAKKFSGDDECIAFVDNCEQLLDKRERLKKEDALLNLELERISGWGNFDPNEVERLKEDGISLSFYTMAPKQYAKLDKSSLDLIELRDVNQLSAFALVNSEEKIEGADRFVLPRAGADRMRYTLSQHEVQQRAIAGELRESTAYLEDLKRYSSYLQQDVVFEHISSQVGGDDRLIYLEGFLPEKKQVNFEAVARAKAWGYAIDEIGEEDNPPTMLSYPKGFEIIQPVYDLMGTYPGYRERDISVPFLIFFVIFFAMIIADGGYGLIFIAIALALKKKKGKSPVSSLVLVLGLATTLWGALGGTWFGSEVIFSHLPFLQKLVIPQISNFPQYFNVSDATVREVIMTICFTLGTVQLILACAMNIVYKAPRKDLSWVADAGWAMDIFFLFFVVLSLVCDINVALFPVKRCLAIVGAGFIIVTIFGNQAPGKPFSKGLKEGLGAFLPTFLDTISAFSNTMSYIRLFAVSMAGFAIANNFNLLAEQVVGVKGVGVLMALVILLIGHSLNFVMNLLSVVVHGIRLNILEFSNQLGQEWSGYKYDPFRETVNE